MQRSVGPGNRRYIQGYNAQAVVNEQQIVLAAEITADAGDFSHLRPMITAALRELEAAGGSDKPGVAVGDAQYWNEQQMDDVTAEHGIQVLIPPDSGKRKEERPAGAAGGIRSCAVSSRLTSVASCTEWRLIMMSHNLTKLYRHQPATVGS